MNLMKVLSLHKMVFVLILNLVLLINTNINAQRTHHDIEREETLRNRQQNVDIGEFPYNRGETPIFNFDIGDEPFLQTIPDLVTGLRDMANVVAEQTKVTGAYGAAFLDCPDCKF